MSFVHHFFSCPQGRETISQVLSCALWTLEPTRWMCQWSAATGGCWVRWLLEGLASCCSLVVPLWIFMAAWCQDWSWHQINCSLDGEFLETLAMGWDGGFTWILMGSRVHFAHVYRVFKGSYRTSPKIGMISSMIRIDVFCDRQQAIAVPFPVNCSSQCWLLWSSPHTALRGS